MAKTAPFMTVEFKVEQSDVELAAECIVDDFYDDYNTEAIEALGLGYKAFLKEVIEMYEFSVMVRKGVEKYGPDALNDPWDYMDFETVTLSPAFKKIRDVLEMLEDVLTDAEKHERAQRSNACEDAIETLKRAGFKIVKA